MNKKYLIVAVAFWIIALVLVTKFSTYFIANRTSYELPQGINIGNRSFFLPWLNFDGRNFLDIANSGYFQKGQYNLRAFFPAFPLFIYFFSKVTSISLVYSGLFVSFIGTMGSFFLLFKLAKKENTTKVAYKTILLLLTFPTSFFLLAYYSESIYLFFSLAVFWFLKEKRFGWATFFAILASGTRVVGVTLSLAVLYEAYNFFKAKKKFPWISIFSPLGIGVYSVYSYFTAGDAFVFMHSWSTWKKTFSIFGPVKSLINGIYNVVRGPQPSFDSPFVYPVSILELASLVFLVGIVIWSYKKLKPVYWYYLVINSYIFLAGGILQSLPRYILVLFPIYIFLAGKLKGKSFLIYNLVSTIILVVTTSIFLRGYWIS